MKTPAAEFDGAHQCVLIDAARILVLLIFYQRRLPQSKATSGRSAGPLGSRRRPHRRNAISPGIEIVCLEQDGDAGGPAR